MLASHAQTSNEEKLSYHGFNDEVHNYINEIEKTGKRSPRTDCVNCGAKSGGIGGDLCPDCYFKEFGVRPDGSNPARRGGGGEFIPGGGGCNGSCHIGGGYGNGRGRR